MEENLLQTGVEHSETKEPETISDNSEKPEVSAEQDQQKEQEGQAEAPSNLILGKFKSQEDLVKAYQELEKYQGIQSQELGTLRQDTAMLGNIKQAWEMEKSVRNAEKELRAVAEKYNTPEYFQNPTFRQIYREAYLALGKNLDTEKLISLVEGYVSSRIFEHERTKSANAETQNAISGMTFEKNDTTSFTPPQKRLDEMTKKELDELLEKMI